MTEQKSINAKTPQGSIFDLACEIRQFINERPHSFYPEEIFEALMIASQALIGIEWTARYVADRAPKPQS